MKLCEDIDVTPENVSGSPPFHPPSPVSPLLLASLTPRLALSPPPRDGSSNHAAHRAPFPSINLMLVQ
jgi:hypothetical protein